MSDDGPSKRFRHDDEHTASTFDPVTMALVEVCKLDPCNGSPRISRDPIQHLYDLIVAMLPCDNKERLACRAPLLCLIKHCCLKDGSFDVDVVHRLLGYALSSSTVIVDASTEMASSLVDHFSAIVVDFYNSVPVHYVSTDSERHVDDGPASLCLFGAASRTRCTKGVAVHCAEWALVCPQPRPLLHTRHAVIVSALCTFAGVVSQFPKTHGILRLRADVVRAVIYLIGSMNAPEYKAVRQGALFLALSMIQHDAAPGPCLSSMLVHDGVLGALIRACDAANPHSIRITALVVLKNLIDVYPENRREAAQDTDVVQLLFRMLRNRQEQRLHHAAVITLASFCCTHGCADDALTGALLIDAVLTLLITLGRTTDLHLSGAITEVICTAVRQQGSKFQTTIGTEMFPVLARMLSYAERVSLIHIDIYVALCNGSVLNTTIAIDIFIRILTATRPRDGGPSLIARSGALRLLKIISELDNYAALQIAMDRRAEIAFELQRIAHPSSSFEDYIRQVADHVLQATVGRCGLQGTLRILHELPVFPVFCNASDTCPICQTGNDDATQVVMPSTLENGPGVIYSACCSKGFHVRCITPWIISRPVGFDTCPLCRHGFTAEVSKKWAAQPAIRFSFAF